MKQWKKKKMKKKKKTKKKNKGKKRKAKEKAKKKFQPKINLKEKNSSTSQWECVAAEKSAAGSLINPNQFTDRFRWCDHHTYQFWHR